MRVTDTFSSASSMPQIVAGRRCYLHPVSHPRKPDWNKLQRPTQLAIETNYQQLATGKQQIDTKDENAKTQTASHY